MVKNKDDNCRKTNQTYFYSTKMTFHQFCHLKNNSSFYVWYKGDISPMLSLKKNNR
jgi:hypothetical protein